MAARKKKEVIKEEIKIEEIAIEQPIIEAPVKKVSKKNHIEITYPGVNVRADATLMAPVLTIAYEGDKFDLIQKELVNEFYKIKYENGFAFIKSDFAKIV